jgi:hypothetical protein
MSYLTAIRKRTMTVGEDFPFSGQDAPPAAALTVARHTLSGRPTRTTTLRAA